MTEVVVKEEPKEIESKEEEVVKKPRAKKAKKTYKLDLTKYLEVVKVLDPNGHVVEKEIINEKYNNHLQKCKIRTAKAFDVNIEHLEDAYFKLSGKKIDGFFVNDLLDRFGFSTGQQESRSMLSSKYNLGTNQRIIDVAEEKLKNILDSEDVLKKYKSYLEDLKMLSNKEMDDKATYGE